MSETGRPVDWLRRIAGRPLDEVRPDEVPCTCLLQYRPYAYPYLCELQRDDCCPRHRVWPHAFPANIHDLARGAR